MRMPKWGQSSMCIQAMWAKRADWDNTERKALGMLYILGRSSCLNTSPYDSPINKLHRASEWSDGGSRVSISPGRTIGCGQPRSCIHIPPSVLTTNTSGQALKYPLDLGRGLQEARKLRSRHKRRHWPDYLPHGQRMARASTGQTITPLESLRGSRHGGGFACVAKCRVFDVI